MENSAYKEHAWYFWYYHDHFRAGEPCCFGDQYFWSPVDTFPNPNILLHSKVYHCQYRETANDGAQSSDDGRGWTYAGSHNLTRSAWGEELFDVIMYDEQAGPGRTKNNSRLHIRNFELGVVFFHSKQTLEAIYTPYNVETVRPYSESDKPWNNSKK